MSRILTVELAISTFEVLTELCNDLADARARAREETMIDSEGHRHDVVGTLERDGMVLGVVRSGDGLRLVPRDCHDPRARTFAETIRQRYAYSLAVDQLRRQGYAIAREERQADGSIRLVARKYGG